MMHVTDRTSQRSPVCFAKDTDLAGKHKIITFTKIDNILIAFGFSLKTGLQEDVFH